MMMRGGISGALAAVVVVVLLALVAFVVLVLVWFPGSPPSNPTTMSTVSTPANLVAFVQPTPQTACAGQSYSNSSLAINWGNLAPGTEGIEYMCLENTGATPVTLAITSTLSPSIGRVTSPQTGRVLNGRGIIQVELDLWVFSNVQPGPLPAFTTTVAPMGAKG